MLRSVLITSSSGMVLFQKEWVKLVAKGQDMSRLIGGLVTTIQEFSRQNAGMPVAYIEFEMLAVSMYIDGRTGLICTLFHDKQDGAPFGRLVAKQIVVSFVEEFKLRSSEDVSKVFNVSKFNVFQTRIADVIASSVKPLMQQLQRLRGVKAALVVHADDSVHYAGQLEDDLGMVANMQALMTLSNALMQGSGDLTSLVSMEMTEHFVCIYKIGESTLVTIVRNNIAREEYNASVQETIQLVSQVLEVVSNLRGEI